jgi:hypothetical protein
MSTVWFSAMLRFVILVEHHDASLSRSLIVFQEEDWSEAKTRAVDIGHGMERTYTGGTGDEVRWRLEAIETLDMLGDLITDGQEVYSEQINLPEGRAVAFDAEFDPARSDPGQSGV